MARARQRLSRLLRLLSSSRRRVLVVLVVAVLLIGAVGSFAALTAQPTVRKLALTVPVGAGADGKPVALDTTLFFPPAGERAPAVVLAHGFGGSKDDEQADAVSLARHGYVVLTYSARGFGSSTGQISLDSRYEVQDAQRLVDLLGRRPEVRSDAPGDPRVGFAGESYGGALSLLVAGVDRRVDAIVPSITWNDLGQSLFPQFATSGGASSTPAQVVGQGAGVFKRLWAGLFFGAGSEPQGAVPTPCGRFAAQLCAAYESAAGTGRPNPTIRRLLRESNPASVAGQITAPTLLIQGETDSLFPLSEADANARAIAGNGTPVKVVWYAGGHDGGSAEAARRRDLTTGWFDHYLRRDGSPPDTRFEVTKVAAGLSTTDSTAASTVVSADGYPGLTGHRAVGTKTVQLNGSAQTIVSPAGGDPAEITALPGLGSVLGLVGGGPGSLPGQDAQFDSPVLTGTVALVGAPSVDVRISSSTGNATLFAKLYDVSADGRESSLPQQLASPLRLEGLPTLGRTVRIVLPAVAHDFPTGHRLRLVVSSTDQGYALPQDSRTYRIALAGARSVILPTVPLQATGGTRGPLIGGAGAGLLLLALAGLWLARRLRRAGAVAGVDAALADVPLVIGGLGKAYADGFRAVDDLSFRVERGQVVGLLGPNGAGKTTTMRMLLGLIRPTDGEIRVFGHRIGPGAPVLSRVGALVEGPGFLPHLSGRGNLLLYWRTTGRPIEAAHLEEALAIAGLGADIERKVRKYSHGMRQRLAIAQAMLGLPDLLVLDEPTDGLDPPQIREMRSVLRAYAEEGRTVLVSSHQLAEVEQTCTHCVVMHRGQLVAHGSVGDLVGAARSVALVVDDPARAAEVARRLGATDISISSAGLTLTLDGAPPAALVRALVEAGVAVDQLSPQRRLEQAFLSLVGSSQ